MAIVESVDDTNWILTIEELNKQLNIHFEDLKNFRRTCQMHPHSMPENYEKSLKFQMLNKVIKISEDIEIYQELNDY